MDQRTDPRYPFWSQFDPNTGLYIRSNLLDAQGNDTGEEPFMASFPHLLDIGIMGHCEHGSKGLCIQSGVECYQNGLNRHQPNMSFDDFAHLADQCRGRVNQFALGGRGDPDMHADFQRILEFSREMGIVPNMTTSGLGMTPEKARIIARNCGAAAVSWYRSDYTRQAIDFLLSEGVHTNIHYVLGNQSIDEAIDLIENKKIPKGIGRVIFLLHKPVGLGSQENVLDVMDGRVRHFFGLFNDGENCRVSGFDSCCVPGLLNMARKVHPASIEPCEGGRFSAYVTPDMQFLPCSFDQEQRWAVSLKDTTLQDAWYSPAFESFRDHMRQRCPSCTLKPYCLGGCPVKPEIVLCGMVRGGIPIENTN